jgi:hypothetical protein
VEHVFDLEAGQLQLVEADAAALAAREAGIDKDEDRPSRLMHCYGEPN